MPPTIRNWRTSIRGGEFKLMRLQDAGHSITAIDTPEKVVEYLSPKLAESLMFRPDVENFIVIHLNTRKHPIGFEVVSNGTIDTLLIHPREVFKSAIVINAAAVTMVHNHPSGDPCPSEADIKLTRDYIQCGQMLKIEIVDHIVLGRSTPERVKGFASLRELGYFYN